MPYLTEYEANNIITEQKFNRISTFPNVEFIGLAIRCNNGPNLDPGDGYNLDPSNFVLPSKYVASLNIPQHIIQESQIKPYTKYATALYASIHFSVQIKSENSYLFLLKNCATQGNGEYYTTANGYKTLPKCNGLGASAQQVTSIIMNDTVINMARWVVEQTLASLN